MPETNQDFDLSLLYEIADGSNEFLIDSINMFLQQTPALVEVIETAINGADWVAAGGAAHKLKPNLGFFGMLDCQAIIQDVELLSKAGGQEPDTIRSKFNQAKGMIDSALIGLAKVKAEKEALL